MRKRDSKLLTTLLLLALTALVGGVGNGLHSWFRCCDGCAPSRCRVFQRLVQSTVHIGNADSW